MRARTDFEARAREVEEMLDYAAPGWWPGRTAGSEAVGLASGVPVGPLARSSLVLLVSYFEGFLKDLADEAFDRMLDAALPCSSLPDAMRGQSLLRHVRSLRSSTDGIEVWTAAVRLGREGLRLDTEAPVTEELLPRDETKRELSSIEPQKINALLRALADRDLRTGPMSRHSQRLRGLKQLRDNAVHGNEQDLPAIAFGDVANALELLRSCGDDLEGRVEFLLAELGCTSLPPSA